MDHRYDFTLLSALNECSLTTLLAGMTKNNLKVYKPGTSTPFMKSSDFLKSLAISLSLYSSRDVDLQVVKTLQVILLRRFHLNLIHRIKVQTLALIDILHNLQL